MAVREEGGEFALRRDFYKRLLDTFAAFVPLCRFLNAPLLDRTNVLMFPLGDREQHRSRDQRVAAHQQLLRRRAGENTERHH